MTTVYKHTFPDGKIYIGIADNVEKRWNNGEGYRENPAMHDAIIKYGWNNIKHEILVMCETREEALSYERNFIIFYDSENPQNGYNRTNIVSELQKLENNAAVYDMRSVTVSDAKYDKEDVFYQALNDWKKFFQMPYCLEYIKLLLRMLDSTKFLDGKFYIPRKYEKMLDTLSATNQRVWTFKEHGNNPHCYKIWRNISLTPFDYETAAETGCSDIIIYPYDLSRIQALIDSVVVFNGLRFGDLEYVGHGIVMDKEE